MAEKKPAKPKMRKPRQSALVQIQELEQLRERAARFPELEAKVAELEAALAEERVQSAWWKSKAGGR